jgi:hypothetical protein
VLYRLCLGCLKHRDRMQTANAIVDENKTQLVPPRMESEAVQEWFYPRNKNKNKNMMLVFLCRYECVTMCLILC